MTLKILHNPRCSKSRETLALLESRGLTPHVIEYLKTPPTPGELKSILKALGVPAREIVRKKEALEAKVDPDALSETALIAAMSANPAIIERPIVINGAKAAVGRPPERVLDIL